MPESIIRPIFTTKTSWFGYIDIHNAFHLYTTQRNMKRNHNKDQDMSFHDNVEM